MNLRDLLNFVNIVMLYLNNRFNGLINGKYKIFFFRYLYKLRDLSLSDDFIIL